MVAEAVAGAVKQAYPVRLCAALAALRVPTVLQSSASTATTMMITLTMNSNNKVLDIAIYKLNYLYTYKKNSGLC